MSFEDIKIVRKLPVINGYVQLPNNLEKDKTAVTKEELLANDGDTEKSLDGVNLNRLVVKTGGVSTAGGKFGQQEFIEFEVPFGDVQGQQANLVDGNIVIE